MFVPRTLGKVQCWLVTEVTGSVIIHGSVTGWLNHQKTPGSFRGTMIVLPESQDVNVLGMPSEQIF